MSMQVRKELEMWAGVLTIAAAFWFVFFLGVSFLVRVLYLVMRSPLT